MAELSMTALTDTILVTRRVPAGGGDEAQPVDARLGPDATYGRDWLPVHQSNLKQARGR
jgi:hypothetical protein